MQPDNTELVREVIGALNRGDVDGMLARLDPDFEWTPLEDSPIAGTHRGHARVRRYVEDWLSTFDGLRLETEELTELDDRVLVVVRGRARGRASGLAPAPGLVGLELDNRFCQLWMLRGGTAVSMEEYATREQALAAQRAADAEAESGPSR
jgi:ketosteroid isomerase-like protein